MKHGCYSSLRSVVAPISSVSVFVPQPHGFQSDSRLRNSAVAVRYFICQARSTNCRQNEYLGLRLTPILVRKSGWIFSHATNQMNDTWLNAIPSDSNCISFIFVSQFTFGIEFSVSEFCIWRSCFRSFRYKFVSFELYLIVTLQRLVLKDPL